MVEKENVYRSSSQEVGKAIGPGTRLFFPHICIYLSYLFLTILLTYPLIIHIGDAIPMPRYIHDTPHVHTLWLNLWWLWHTKTALVDLHQIPLFTDLLFYPIGIRSSLPYLIQCAYPSLLFIPISLLFAVVTSGNLLLLLSISLSGYTTFVLGRHLFKDGKAAYLTGLAFAFACPQMANAQGHLLMVSVLPLLPLFMLFLIRLGEQKRTRYIVLLSLISILLVFSYWYFLVFVSIFSLIHICLRPFSRDAMIRLAKSAALSAMVFVPLVLLLLLEQEGMPLSAPLHQAREWSVDLVAFFIHGQDHPLFGPYVQPIRDTFLANPTIQSAYLGYLILALALLGFFQGPRRPLAPWITGFLLFSLLALGPTLHVKGQSVFHMGNMVFSIPLPFVLFHKIPVLSGVRDCSIFLIMSSLCLAVLAGYGVKVLMAWVGNKATMVYPVVLLLILLDGLAIPFPIFPVHIPGVYASLKENPGPGSLAEVPMRPEASIYLFYQTIHQKRLLGGAFGRMPETYQAYGYTGSFLPILQDPQRLVNHQVKQAGTLEDDISWAMRFFDMGAIVVHRDLLSPAQWEALDRFLKENLNVRTMLDVGQPAVLFRLNAPPPSSPQQPMVIDFGSPPPHPYLHKGWSAGETWDDDCRFQWSDRKASDLYFYISEASPFRISLRLRPFSYSGALRQTVRIHLNGTCLDTLTLTTDQWDTYAMDIPRRTVTSGVNHLQFVYGYTARPSNTLPGSHDARTLGVAFDVIHLVPIQEGERYEGRILSPQPGA